MPNKISEFLQTRIAAGDFPSAVYLVAEKGEVILHDAVGHAVVEPERIEARLDTIYDVASLTKPLVTGLLLAREIGRGAVSLDSVIGGLISEFENAPIGDRTVLDFATHASGLPAWRPFYLLTDSSDRSALAAVIGEQDLRSVREVEYSDLNFIALSMVLGMNLDSAFGEVVEQLGLRRTGYNPSLAGLDRRAIAACERGNEYEKQTCIDLGYLQENGANFRNYQIWGEVHDGNAYFMGGVAGHAGLFSTAEDVFKIAQQFLPNYTRLLNRQTCTLFHTNFTEGLNEDRSFAFQLASTEGSTAGTMMSPGSFGHNGFTGTSLWIDPEKERVFILLTNRTHAHPIPFVNINSVRRRFHDLAIELLDAI